MRTGLLSLALVTALAAAAKADPKPPCPRCQDSAGLCSADYCQRQVLPVLKEPSLHRAAAAGRFHEVTKRTAPPADDAATRKAKRREERKHTRARARARDRLANEMVQGPFTRSRSAAS